MTEINDMNDALKEGFSLEELEKTASFMKADPEKQKRSWAEEGYADLLILVQAVQELISPQPIRGLDKARIKTLAWAYLYRQEDVKSQFEKIAKVQNCRKPLLYLRRKIKADARKILRDEKNKKLTQQRRFVPEQYKPDPSVNKLLKWKTQKDKDTGLVFPTTPYHIPFNAEMVLRHDPRIVGRIQHCQLDGTTHLDHKTITDNDETRLLHWLFRVYAFEINPKRWTSVIALVAEDNPYHPVQDYLDNLTWDGKSRLWSFYQKYVPCALWSSQDAILGNVADEWGEVADYSHMGIPLDENPNIWMIYAIRFFVALVARAYEPGVKQDVCKGWIGGQDTNKSSTIEAISPNPEWWSDSDFDITNKDSNLILLGKWLVEIPECESLNRVSHNASKAFLSRRKVRFRRPFGRNAIEVNFSHCIFLTSNQDRLRFLNDPTGSRRYWMVMLKEPANIWAIVEDRDEMWAEAVHLYEDKKVNHWLTDEEQSVSSAMNSRYRSSDTWEEKVAIWVSERADKDGNCKKFTLATVLEQALEIPARYQKAAEQSRVAEILRHIGAKKVGRVRIGKTRHHQWSVDKEVLSNIEVEEEEKGVDTRYQRNYH